MHTVVLTELGIAVYQDDAKLYSIPFENPAEEYVAIKQQKSIPADLATRLIKEQSGVLVTDESLMSMLKNESIDAQMAGEEYLKKIQMEKPKILVESGFASDENDALEKLRDFAMSLSSSKVTEVSSSPDLHVIQSINTLDEVDKVCNALSSRLREWYGLHFPELDNIIDGIAGYSKIVTTGRREDLNEDAFTNAGFPESKVNMLNVVQEKSRGGEISDENLEIVKSLAQRMLDMLDLRKNLEDHLEKEMNNVAPNLAIILGTGVAARMLSRTGSLKKLSSLPASTIQVLGAERALFRSLKTGAPPPKHGILFQHTLVHAAPRWQRGKIARAVAAKAVIAARVDVYGNGVNATLMEKLNLRIKEIDTKYSDAPEPRPDAANNERDHNSKAWDKNKDDFKSNRDSKPRGGFRDKDRGSSRDGDRGSFDKFKKRGDDRGSGGYRRDDDKGGFDKFKKRSGDRGSGGYRRDDDRGGFRRDNDRGGYRRDDDRGGFDKFKKRGDDRGSGGYRRDGDRGGFRRDNDRGGYRRDDDKGSFDKFKKRGDDRSSGGYSRDNDRGGFRRDNDRGGFRRDNDRGGYSRDNDREIMTEADLDEIMTEADTAEMMIKAVLINSKNAAMIVARADMAEMMIEVDSEEIMIVVVLEEVVAVLVQVVALSVVVQDTRIGIGLVKVPADRVAEAEDLVEMTNDVERKNRASVLTEGRHKGTYLVRSDGRMNLATENLVPGNTVYNERLVVKKGIEYRTWDPFRSKLAASIKNGLETFPFKRGSSVLYLGVSSGTTASHISDIVGVKGMMFCVEHASRVARDFLDRVASHRKNIVPVLQDARRPREYSAVYGKVDIVYADIAQPDQTQIVLENCQMYLKDGGVMFLVIKTRSIDVIKTPRQVINEEKEKISRSMDVLELIDLMPYDKDHAMIVAH